MDDCHARDQYTSDRPGHGKNYFGRANTQKEEKFALCESHPQKEKVERYAASFQKLAETFYGMPYRRNISAQGRWKLYFRMLAEKCAAIAITERSAGRKRRSLKAGRRGDDTRYGRGKRRRGGDYPGRMGSNVLQISSISGSCPGKFQKEKQNLIWNNRMIESRLAVAQQLTETARIMETVAEDLYDIALAGSRALGKYQKIPEEKNIVLKNAWVMDKVEGRRQMFLTMRARSGQCVSVTEVAQMLSGLCECAMTSAEDSRCIVNGEYHTVHFVEDCSYQVMYGAAKLTREEEKVSGDNYICRQEEDRFVMCLSDGMGSGMDACRESEIVVELLEQFLESGFSQETAARMVNSALVLKGREGMFFYSNICALDLYTGICSFLKAGAASTFIKKEITG